ncbi:MAG: hypothetical protein ABI528_06155 [bacterium]
MKKLILLFPVLFIAVYFTACTSVTEISGTWKKPATASKKYSKIMVLGLSGEVVNRSAVENAIVAKLKTYGINAVAGTNILPDSFVDSDNNGKVDNENKDIFSAKLKDQGIDGVFTISLKDVKENERYVPGTTYYTPSTVYYPFYNYYWQTYNVVHTPGYLSKSTNYFLTSNFYNMSDDQLIWSAQSETINPQSLKDFSKSYSAAVVDDFVSSGLVLK